MRRLTVFILAILSASTYLGFDRMLPIKNVTLDLRSGKMELWSFDFIRSKNCDIGIHSATRDNEGRLFIDETKYLSHEDLSSLYPDLKGVKIPRPNRFPHAGYFVIATELHFYCNPIHTIFPVKFRIERGYIAGENKE